jgi:pyruvate kinase
MQIARFNVSHGTTKSNARTMKKFKEAAKLRPHVNVGLMLDLRGREIRTTGVENE